MIVKLYVTYNNDHKFDIGGISISQKLFSKGLEMAKTRAKLIRSVINAAISLNKNDVEINI